MNNTSKLFKPLRLGDITIPNRIIMAAMTRMRCDNATKIPNDLLVEYYS
jgi:2,4-dienoyl-CoA reductase-like NADH-dependent reductase (Old Yellow Enzyme family)